MEEDVIAGFSDFDGQDLGAEEQDSLPLAVVEYENFKTDLEVELETYRTEYRDLKKNVFALITENKQLEEKLNSFYKNNVTCPSETLLEAEIISNLRSRLKQCMNDREKLQKLYEDSMRATDNLELELENSREGLRNRKHRDIKTNSDFSVLEKKCASLKMMLQSEKTERERVELQRTESQAECERLKIVLEAERQNVEDCGKREKKLLEQFNKMEQENMLLNATVECVTNTRNELEKTLQEYHTQIVQLTSCLNEAKEKVAEALDVADRAIAEQNAGVVREVQMQEEINHLQQTLQQLIDDAGRKLEHELSSVKQKYNANIEQLLTELQNVKQLNQQQTIELQQLTVNCHKLEKINNSKSIKEKISLIRGSEAEISVLENQIDVVYKELADMKLMLEYQKEENQKLKFELSDLTNRYAELLDNYNLEKCNRAEELKECKAKLESTIKSYQEAEKSNLLLTQSQIRSQDEQFMLTQSQLEQLEQHIKDQVRMKEKWKQQVQHLMVTFEDKSREMKKEIKYWRMKYKKIKN